MKWRYDCNEEKDSEHHCQISDTFINKNDENFNALNPFTDDNSDLTSRSSVRHTATCNFERAIFSESFTDNITLTCVVVLLGV